MSQIIASPSFSDRRGSFRLDRGVLERVLAGDIEQLAMWSAIFSSFVCIRAEYKWGDMIDYDGYHPKFKQVAEGAMGPKYQVTINRSEESGVVSFHATFNEL